MRSRFLFAFAAQVANGQVPAPIAGLKTWTVSAPLVAIGSDANPNTTFKGLSAVRTLSGDIVALDDASNELRVFSPSGTYTRTLARRGSGPGELEGRATMFAAGDTVFVFENNRRLLQAFTPHGGLIWQKRASAANAPGILVLARLSTGAYLASLAGSSGQGFVAIDPNIRAGDRFGANTTLGLTPKADSGTVTTIGAYSSSSMYAYATPLLGGRLGIARLAVPNELIYASSGDRVWIGKSGSPEIVIYNAQGVRAGAVTLPIKPRPLERATLARVHDRVAAVTRGEPPRAGVDAQYSAGALPDTAPFCRSLLAAPGGEMWVQLFGEDPDAPTRDIAYDRTGNALAQIVLPARFRATQIGPDYVLGIQRDDDDVESIVMLALHR